MISKEARERDRGICEAATPEWIVVQPRSQEGGPTLGHTGPSFGNTFPAATSFRAATGDPFDALSWEQHAANAAAAVTGRNRLPLYIAALDEAERERDEVADDVLSLLDAYERGYDIPNDSALRDRLRAFAAGGQ